ncbi:MAG: hypothetical protein P8Z30_03665 [Acidobacteriota bacterium]
MKLWGTLFAENVQTELSALRVRRASLAILFLCAVAMCFAVAPAQAAESTGVHVLQGKLLYVKGSAPVVITASRQYSLAGRYPYILQTLEDKRLRNDEVRLKGEFLADGKFRVDDLYTIHHGDLYRIRYFCETCNIAALGPGHCVCCQKPTELQEIPLNKNDKKVLITR